MSEHRDHELKELVQKVERVLSYIENDSTTGRKGLFAQVNENRENIEELQRNSFIKKGMMIGWGAAGSAIVILVKIIIDLITNP